MAAPAPVPAGSRLLLLHQVPEHPGTKVRFLGCITTRDPTSPLLTLTHPPARAAVAVDISLVSGGLAGGSLRDGEWVHVLGYTPGEGEGEGGGGGEGEGGVVVVTALALWGAGQVALGEYVRVVRGLAGA